jgi:cytochrome c556
MIVKYQKFFKKRLGFWDKITSKRRGENPFDIKFTQSIIKDLHSKTHKPIAFSDNLWDLI